MSDLPQPSIEQGARIEKPAVPKPAEPPKEAAPLGQAEQQIVSRIIRDGDEDKVLRDIAGVNPPAVEASSASATGRSVMDEKEATKILGTDRPATNAEKIAAATQFPDIAARWGWSSEDIEELKHDEEIREKDTKGVQDETTASQEQQRQELFGELYGDLLASFSETPDITKEQLMQKIGEYAREHRLAGPNLGIAIGITNRFCRTRDLVRDAREQHPDDRALFEHTFGFSPQGEVTVNMGTIDIAFHIPNVNDRARANSGNVQTENRASRTAAGMTLHRVHDKLLSGLVITLEYNDTPDVLDHERQHVVNNQLLSLREVKAPIQSPDTISEKIKDGENPEAAIDSYLGFLTEIRLRQASDEIIAFFAGGTRVDQIKQALTQHNTTYGERFRGLTPGLENAMVEKVGETHRPYVVEQGEKQLGTGYDQAVRDCVDAFAELRSRGYSQEKAVGILGTLPPQDWREFVTNMKLK